MSSTPSPVPHDRRESRTEGHLYPFRHQSPRPRRMLPRRVESRGSVSVEELLPVPLDWNSSISQRQKLAEPALRQLLLANEQAPLARSSTAALVHRADIRTSQFWSEADGKSAGLLHLPRPLAAIWSPSNARFLR